MMTSKPQKTETDIRYLKGIGEKRAAQFKKLGIRSVGDLLYTFPRRYEDWKHVIPIKNAPRDEKVCFKAEVSYRPSVYLTPGGVTITKFSVTDGESVVLITLFRRGRYAAGEPVEGEEYLFYGKLQGGLGGYYEMTSPEFLPAEGQDYYHPVYALTAGLTAKTVTKAVMTALDYVKDEVPDTLPEETRTRYGLPKAEQALRMIHFPQSEEEIRAARRRLIYDELLVLQLGLLKKNEAAVNTQAYAVADDGEAFFQRLPFSPTGAQRRAVKECLTDMAGAAPMRRLLQGDVGSGKTAVAAALIWCTAKSGFQSALMAPTEVLAQQHYATFTRFFEGTDIRVALLTGSTGAAERKRILAGLNDGSVDLLIGTHALITQNVSFRALALCVTDEQHRFGVTQRAALSAKGRDPHVLVMSATPIPRTLSLIIYGDLAISVLDEKPAGRQDVDTYAVTSDFHPRIHAFIKKQLDAGRQGYIVCPLVEEPESEDDDEETKNRRISAREYMEELSSGVFKDYPTALLHGKLKPKEKDDVMRRFAAGEIKLLICTTVIEVGVDVPNANVIVIENAECFGLSQLHQLRGRTGRGSEKSYCILISDAKGDRARERFDIMTKTNDGFLIAEKDLQLRGPGDFFGARQSGLPELRIADLMTDSRIMAAAGRDAKRIVAQDPYLSAPEHSELRKSVERLFADIS